MTDLRFGIMCTDSEALVVIWRFARIVKRGGMLVGLMQAVSRTNS
jgi:hypothetical protein